MWTIFRPTPPNVERRRDGRRVTEHSVDRALTTRAILDEETAGRHHSDTTYPPEQPSWSMKLGPSRHRISPGWHAWPSRNIGGS